MVSVMSIFRNPSKKVVAGVSGGSKLIVKARDNDIVFRIREAPDGIALEKHSYKSLLWDVPHLMKVAGSKEFTRRFSSLTPSHVCLSNAIPLALFLLFELEEVTSYPYTGDKYEDFVDNFRNSFRKMSYFYQFGEDKFLPAEGNENLIAVHIACECFKELLESGHQYFEGLQIEGAHRVAQEGIEAVEQASKRLEGYMESVLAPEVDAAVKTYF